MFGLRHAPEILRDQLDGLCGVEVAHKGDRGVLGNVVGLVEIADVVDRRGLEVHHAANRRVFVRDEP